ncbi:unnamed protein product [Echinostoma caproni]|uniref:Ubiquitin-like domain-containing protein n=1 Tax=Echinostoma caproni TaxID=27848 RepID=A0A183AXR8_9TREM|nr:unnamed protein product [Echinostoma caproni]
MHVIIRTYDGRECIVDVPPDGTLRDVKDALNLRMGIPVNRQRIVLHPKGPLPDRDLMSQHNIREGSILMLDYLPEKQIRLLHPEPSVYRSLYD